jgi:hypothetical protein
VIGTAGPLLADGDGNGAAGGEADAGASLGPGDAEGDGDTSGGGVGGGSVCAPAGTRQATPAIDVVRNATRTGITDGLSRGGDRAPLAYAKGLMLMMPATGCPSSACTIRSTGIDDAGSGRTAMSATTESFPAI